MGGVRGEVIGERRYVVNASDGGKRKDYRGEARQ